MKTIYKGKDDLYYTVTIKSDKGTLILPSELDAFEIEMFTSGNAKAVFEAEDLT